MHFYAPHLPISASDSFLALMFENVASKFTTVLVWVLCFSLSERERLRGNLGFHHMWGKIGKDISKEIEDGLLSAVVHFLLYESLFSIAQFL